MYIANMSEKKLHLELNVLDILIQINKKSFIL